MAKQRSKPVEINDLSPEAIMADDTPAAPGGEVGTVYQPMMVFTGEDDKKKFTEYITTEILDVRGDEGREDLVARWEKWRRQRLAVPDSATRDTPWIKASNVEPPLTMQKVQTVFAKLIAAFAVKKPPVSVTPLSPNERETADSLERFFKALAENRYGLDVRRKFKQIAYDLVSLGTAVVKVPFKVEQWSFKRTDEAGTQQVSYMRHKGPAIVPIRLEDFFTRPYWKDVQRAPWIAVRYRFFFHELKQMEAQGLLMDVDKVLTVPMTEYDENLTQSLENAGIDAGSLGGGDPNREFELYECNVFWDVDGDGYPEDVIAWVEPTTGTLLRAEFNPLSVRDVEVMTYLENPDSLYGVGICQMVEGLQEEVSALHRMRLDSTQLSMLKMFVARRGSGIGPNEEFYPFKLMLLDDPGADFRPIDFPDISQGALMGEQMAKEYADRVTGANDYMAGFNDKIVGSGATASGTTFLAGQANSILNSLLENTEQSMSTVYMLALYQMIANKKHMDLSFLDVGDQMNVNRVLSMSVEDLPTKFRFSVRTTDINKTDESRKQSFLMASQLYNQYGQTALQYLGMKANPQLGQMPEVQELLTSMYIGQTMLAERVLEFFDVGNPQDFVPFVEHLKVQMRAMDQVRNEQVSAMKEAQRGQEGGIGGGTAGAAALGAPGAVGNANYGPGIGPGMQNPAGMAGGAGPGPVGP